MNVTINPRESRDAVKLDVAHNLYKNAKRTISMIEGERERIYNTFVEDNRKKKGDRIGWFKKLKEDETDEEVHYRVLEERARNNFFNYIPWQLKKTYYEEYFDICQKYVKLFDSGLEFTLSYKEYNVVKENYRSGF
jgi:hypothetical protein